MIEQSDNYWAFTPSLGASIFFLVLFLLTTLAHVAQAIYYRRQYSIIIIMSAFGQTLTYIFRTISIKKPSSLSDYEAWFILMLITPVLTNAFVYMVFGRMVWNYTAGHQIWKIKAWHFSIVFVLLDAIALLIQIYGAAKAATAVETDTSLDGLHVYMGGVAIQQVFILGFCLYAGKLFAIMKRSPMSSENRNGLWLLKTLFAVLLLITLRIGFRLGEYSQGLQSTIPNHEAYQYCLDSLPMLAALVLFNIVHPGRIMNGKGSEIPSFRERRQAAKLPRDSDVTVNGIA
ncbi:RTA1 like protein-domain-containing protein [Xylariales sp. PMI_506]|nr:RTA1 like protein-domain-containing protein [Xylariales sp. PMI_506]